MSSFVIWSWEFLIKFESGQGCWQTKCWGDWICGGRLIYDKIRMGDFTVFFQIK